MIQYVPDIGTLAATMVLALSLIQSIVPLIGSYNGNQAMMRSAIPLATGQFIFCVIAFICLAILFLNNEFGVAYVSQHSNSHLPQIYQFAAIWGGHEGSILLWLLMLTGWGFAVAISGRKLPNITTARVLAVMGMISIGIALFMLETSNPFNRVFPPALEGRDLNPLLQDFGLIVHPPMLYMGYVGLSVAFSFAIAALLSGRLDSAWARWTRPWTVVAWVFLTGGIMLGSWWAYYELGWGGWWFWDPVENASFMPWLAATALIHSLAVTEKRGAFKSWTVLLAIICFSLSLLGTFLVRSGVLTSVHAFATDPERGYFILVFLIAVISACLALYTKRIGAVKSATKYDGVSREMLLLLNNIFLMVALFMVLFCTLFPIIAEMFGKKVSIGKPFFDLQFGVIFLPLLILMGFGAISRWKKDTVSRWAAMLQWQIVAALVLGMSFPWLYFDTYSIQAGLGVSLGLWTLFGTVSDVFAKASKSRSFFAGMKKLSRSYYGMQVAHIGLAVCVIGVSCTHHYSVELDIKMTKGESVTIRSYEFVFADLNTVKGPNYDATRATVDILVDGDLITSLYPENRAYWVQTMPMTEAGIDAGLTRDLFVALGEPLGKGAWSFRVQYKPFIRWIWGGGLIMMIGGFLAISDRRYRKTRKKEQQQDAKESEAVA